MYRQFLAALDIIAKNLVEALQVLQSRACRVGNAPAALIGRNCVPPGAGLRTCLALRDP